MRQSGHAKVPTAIYRGRLTSAGKSLYEGGRITVAEISRTNDFKSARVSAIKRNPIVNQRASVTAPERRDDATSKGLSLSRPVVSLLAPFHRLAAPSDQ